MQSLLAAEWVDWFIILLSGASVLGCVLFRRDLVLQASLVFMTFGTFWVSAGTKWPPEKVIGLLLLLCLPAIGAARTYTRAAPIRFGLGLLFAGALLGLLVDLIYPNAAVEGQPLLQRPLVHGLVVLGSYAMGLAYGAWAWQATLRGKGSLRAASVFVTAITANALYGFYQLMAYREGWPFRGIKYWSETYGYGGLETMHGAFRVNGLSTEPKQLSMYCVIAAALVVITLRGEESAKRLRRGALSLGVLLTAFLLAFSGSGLLAGTAVAACFPLVLGALPGRTRTKGVWLGLGLLVAVLPLGGALLSRAESYYKKTVFERMTESIGSDQATPRMEVLVGRLMLEKPELALTGLGVGNYPFMTQHYFGIGAEGRYGISPMTAGWITVLADLGGLGVLGLAVIIGWLCLTLLRKARQRAVPISQRRGLAIALVWLFAASITMLFSNCFYIMCIAIGLAAGEIQRTAGLRGGTPRQNSGATAVPH